jgi:hypothetical protein
MDMKLSSYEEATVTTRSHTLRPSFILAAMWERKHAAGLLFGLALLLSAASGPAQGTFQNLDFESANIPSGTQPGASFSFSAALPGWTGTYGYPIGPGPATFVGYDTVSLGGPGICIIDKVFWRKPYQALQGNFSAFLFGGNSPFGGPTTMTISQTGLVPYDAVSMLMDLDAETGFTVSLGGQTIMSSSLSESGEFSADISAFAGQTVQLSITVPSSPPGDINPNGLLIDDIRFVTIPEPNVFALFALGALLLGRRIQGGQR